MKINQIIEKAIEGGYTEYYRNVSAKQITAEEARKSLFDYERYTNEKILLDPLFWQSLGKALGWGEVKPCPSCDGGRKEFCDFHDPITHQNYPTTCGVCNGEGYYPSERSDDNWKEHWHLFIDHLIAGKSIESFFEEF